MSIMVFKPRSAKRIIYDGTSIDKAYAWSDLTSDPSAVNGYPPNMTQATGSSGYFCWVAVSLAAGTTYGSGFGDDMGNNVELYDAAGTRLAYSYYDYENWQMVYLSYTPSSAGVYYLKFIVPYYDPEYKPELSFYPRTADPSRPQYGPTQTSEGFDTLGLPIRHHSLSSAGLDTGDIKDGRVLWIPLSAEVAAAQTGQALTYFGTYTFETVDGVKCITFDSSAGRVEFGMDNLPSGDSPRTLTAWARPSSSPAESGDNCIVAYGPTGSQEDGCWCGMEVNPGEGRKAMFWIWGNDLSGGTYVADTWSFFAMTCASPSTRTGYLNAVQVATTTSGSIGTLAQHGGIGAITEKGNVTRKFTGSIADVRIYDRILTLDELTELYQKGPRSN